MKKKPVHLRKPRSKPPLAYFTNIRVSYGFVKKCNATIYSIVLYVFGKTLTIYKGKSKPWVRDIELIDFLLYPFYPLVGLFFLIENAILRYITGGLEFIQELFKGNSQEYFHWGNIGILVALVMHLILRLNCG